MAATSTNKQPLLVDHVLHYVVNLDTSINDGMDIVGTNTAALIIDGTNSDGAIIEDIYHGLGGFMVCKGDDPIAAMWLWLTNSKTAIPAVVVSDKDYQDSDRSDALQLLVDFTTDFAEQMGFKYAFAWAKEGMLLDRYRKAEWYVDETPSYEVIMKY